MSIRPIRAATTALAFALALGLGVLTGCGDDPSGPTQKTDTELNVVLQAPTAPLLTTTTRQVWVKRGTETELRLYYRPLVGLSDSTEFLRLRFRANTLLARPDGSAIAVGDSVQVTVTVPDPTKFLVQLQPTGLRFSAGDPAELKWKLGEKDDDLNDDGVVDATDATLYAQLAVWRQENTGEPWAKLVSKLEVQLEEIDAELLGFSNYVVAY